MGFYSNCEYAGSSLPMGTLQASAVLAILFNLPTRTRLAHPTNGVKFDTLGLLSALSVPRMDWNLPRKKIGCPSF